VPYTKKTAHGYAKKAARGAPPSLAGRQARIVKKRISKRESIRFAGRLMAIGCKHPSNATFDNLQGRASHEHLVIGR